MILCMKASTATRQLEAEQKKGGANSRKAKDLTKNIDQVRHPYHPLNQGTGPSLITRSA